MPTDSETEDTGLRGVIVADTNISMMDSIQREFSYRGYDIYDLASYSTYDEVAFLLIQGNLLNHSQLRAFSSRLKAERELSQGVVTFLEGMLRGR